MKVEVLEIFPKEELSTKPKEIAMSNYLIGGFIYGTFPIGSPTMGRYL